MLILASLIRTNCIRLGKWQKDITVDSLPSPRKLGKLKQIGLVTIKMTGISQRLVRTAQSHPDADKRWLRQVWGPIHFLYIYSKTIKTERGVAPLACEICSMSKWSEHSKTHFGCFNTELSKNYSGIVCLASETSLQTNCNWQEVDLSSSDNSFLLKKEKKRKKRNIISYKIYESAIVNNSTNVGFQTLFGFIIAWHRSHCWTVDIL